MRQLAVIALTLAAATAVATAQAPAPAITITRPADGARIAEADLGGDTIPVEGRLSGGTEPFAVTVNGARASVSPGPRFFKDTRVRSGRNTITVEVTDGAGATATKSVTVTVESGAAPRPEDRSDPGGRDDGRDDPNRWPEKPATRRACAPPRIGFGRVRALRVARISCARAAAIVRSTQRDRGRACTPNRADGKFSRCRAEGFSCYSRFRGSRSAQYACVKGTAAARWFIDA